MLDDVAQARLTPATCFYLAPHNPSSSIYTKIHFAYIDRSQRASLELTSTWNTKSRNKMSASDPPPTISALKIGFLTAQANLLTQPLAPSLAWRASNDASEKRIPDREIEAHLADLNQTVAQHGRRLYAPQAIRHVAEQVNAVYLADAERKLGGPEDAEGGIGKELDLCKYCVCPWS